MGMTTTKITTLEALPETINAETEICIPGHHLVQSEKDPTWWMLVHTASDIPVRDLTVQW